jgi:hypothetical protein
MAPVWAQASAAAPNQKDKTAKDKRTALAANAEPIASQNQRDAFTISS